MKNLWNWLLRLDRNINADVFNGARSETMSARMGRHELKGDYGCCKFRFYICRILSFIDLRKGDHCIESIEIKDNNGNTTDIHQH